MRRIGHSGGARLLLAAALAAGGCIGNEPSPTTHHDSVVEEPPQLLQLVEAEFDGNEFVFHNVEPDRVMEVGQAAGLSVEALTSINSCSGASCTSNAVVFSNGTPTSQPTWSDTAHCGTSPSGSGGNLGVCRPIGIRNAFSTQIERLYIRFSSLTPTSPTTAVSFPTAYPYAASVDFGVSAPGVTNGLRRVGELPVGATASQYWSFTGSTTGTTLAFRFIVEVYGAQARPTGTATSGTVTAISLSEDGSTAVYSLSSTGGLVRRIVASGSDTVVLAGCSISPPSTGGGVSVSANGTIAAFAATGSSATCSLPAISGTRQVYIYNFGTSTASLVSHADGLPTTAGNGLSGSPRISGDGTAVAYQSTARNLTASDPGRNCAEVYRYDVGGDFNDHVSGVRDQGIGSDWVTTCGPTTSPGVTPDISRDGSLIIFASAQNLDGTDGNGTCDAYVYDHGIVSGIGIQYVYRVSAQLSGIEGGSSCLTGSPSTPTISPDGQYVAFASTGGLTVTQRVGNGMSTSITVPSGTRAIYLRSSAEGNDSGIQLVTHTPGTAGTPTSQSYGTNTGTLGTPAISSNGRYVAFVTSSSDLAAQVGSPMASALPSAAQLYVCDMQAVDTSVHRCFVASTTYSGSTTPTFQSGSIATNVRPMMSYTDPTGTGYVGYLASSVGYVSPIGDPRYQQNDYVN